jgi:hypothetical protein
VSFSFYFRIGNYCDIVFFCLHRGDTRHPYNKPEITNCARCGCESSQHEVDEGTDARERGNDSFAEGDYRAALIAYSKYVSYFCHLFRHQ